MHPTKDSMQYLFLCFRQKIFFVHIESELRISFRLTGKSRARALSNFFYLFLCTHASVKYTNFSFYKYLQPKRYPFKYEY